jgi:hypothetical protein
MTLLSLEFLLGALRDPAIREQRLPQRAEEHAAYARLVAETAARSGEQLPMEPGEFVEVVTDLGWALLCMRAMLGPDVISEDFISRSLCLLLPAC